MAATVYTIGHSTLPIGEFIAILQAHGVETLVDVRTVPKSRHNPQFAQDELAASVEQSGIAYRRLDDLGGLRHTRKDSVNTGWHNASFRGYADYMQTDGFARGIAVLEAVVAESVTAIMCAEAVPWRCHRSMIGDALLVRGHRVLDIYSATQAKPEKLTSFAVVDGTDITYPPEL